jgi:hypothetical protein
MFHINYTKHSFKIKEENKKEFIFDEVRRKWVRLTDEEWIRQNFLQYLIKEKQYPASLIGVEKEIKLGELKKRCDIIIYKENNPWMIVECKEPGIVLDEKVFHQILRYNQSIESVYLIITNGSNNFCWKIENNKLTELHKVPEWK